MTTKTMNQNILGNSSNVEKKMNPQQLDQIVEAILAGKYSWACVLILRFAGYNPLHYIPYRTYNRLLKENSQISRVNQQQNENIKVTQLSANKRSDHNVTSSSLNKIKDLAYLEVVGSKAEIRAGNSEQWLATHISEDPSLNSDVERDVNQDFSLSFCKLNQEIA